MRRGLDFEKAEAALKRAAEKATHGTREERSGRFEALKHRRSAAYKVERSRDTKGGGGDKWRKP